VNPAEIPRGERHFSRIIVATPSSTCAAQRALRKAAAGDDQRHKDRHNDADEGECIECEHS
jgi:hypothetical protein